MTAGQNRKSFSLVGLLEVAAGLMCAGSVAGFCGRLWWLFELASHFRLHFALGLGVFALIWLACRRWRMAAICGGFAVLNAALVLSLFWPTEKTGAVLGKPLRLVSLNVLTSNSRADLVLDFLRRTEADVILLMEVNDRWLADLAALQTSYPYQLKAAREDNFGIALFSRIPLTNTSVLELGEAEIPTLTAEIELGGQKIFLLGTHPLPPGSAENSRLRNEQLEKIAATVCSQSLPAIVIGDLNCTPWSPYFSRLLAAGGLKNTSQGLGVFNSWPATLAIVGIPIDHCLVSRSIRVIQKELGPHVGSDHLPVIVNLQLASH